MCALLFIIASCSKTGNFDADDEVDDDDDYNEEEYEKMRLAQ